MFGRAVDTGQMEVPTFQSNAAGGVLEREDRSFSMVRANAYVVALMIPLGAIFFVPYLLLWERLGPIDIGLVPLSLLFMGGIVVHELLHGLTWMLLGNKPAGAVRFGFQVKTLTPYAHCTEPLDVTAYRWGAAVPGLVLGIIPGLAAIALSSTAMLVFGFLFTLAAGGDALILWMLRDVPRGALVEDHPSRAGCYVVQPS